MKTLLLVVVLAALVTSCGGSDAPPIREFSVGESGNDGPFLLTVRDYDCGKNLKGRTPPPPAGSQYCAITIDASNQSGEDAALPRSEQILFVGEQQYTAVDVPIKDMRDFSEVIAAHNGFRGSFVFRIPDGAVPTAVELHGAPGTPGTRWILPAGAGG